MRKALDRFNKLLMPRILDRYIFGEFFMTFLGTMVMLTGILIISLVMDHMQSFAMSNAETYHAVLFVLYSIPKVAVTISAPALMFAVCFVVGQFSVNKELVSMMAAGVSFYRIVTPIMVFGIVVWLSVLFVNETMVRRFNSAAQNELSILLKGMGVIKDLVYQYHIRGKEGYYYIYLYDEKEDKVKGGFNYIRMTTDGLPDYIVSAKGAKYNKDKNNWLLESVEEIRFDSDIKVTSYEKLDAREYVFPESVEYFTESRKDVSEMNFFELGDEISVRLKKGIPFYDLLVERHAVFAMPIMNLIVLVIGAIAGSFTKRSAGDASLGITIILVLFYYIFYSAGRSLGETGVIPAGLAVWYTPVLFLGIAYWFYRKFNL